LTYTDNAYVAGLKEDLGFQGNELVRLQTMYVVGSVVGQLPFMYLFTRIPMFYLIPFLDVAWGIFTLLQYRVHSFAELAAYRFLVGLFEAAFFPAIHYIFGSLSCLSISPQLTMYQGRGTEAMKSAAAVASSTLALPWVLSPPP
jgi:MFS family permease